MRMVGLILSILVFMGVFSASAPMLVQGQAMANPAKVADAKMALRTLYIDHIFWVRSLVISTRLGEKQAVSEADEYVLANAMSIDATAKKDWSREADMWEPMVKEIYALSDALADGIAKQFPEKFQ